MFRVPDVAGLNFLLLIGSAWLVGSIFKGKRLYGNGFFDILGIFKVEMKVFMDSFEIWYSMWNLRYKSAVAHTSSRGSSFSSSFLRKFLLSFNHSLNSFWKIEFSVPIYDLFQNPLSTLQFLLVDSVEQVYFAVPWHWSGNKLVLFSWEIAVRLSRLWQH